jgi:hypothetical protein
VDVSAVLFYHLQDLHGFGGDLGASIVAGEDDDVEGWHDCVSDIGSGKCA